MREQLLEMLAVISDPDIVHASAAAMRKMFNALCQQGFSEDQAMQIVIAHGMVARVNS